MWSVFLNLRSFLVHIYLGRVYLRTRAETNLEILHQELDLWTFKVFHQLDVAYTCDASTGELVNIGQGYRRLCLKNNNENHFY